MNVDFNFKRDSAFKYICRVENVWLDAGSDYRIYHSKLGQYYCNDWFNSISANESWRSYFRLVTVNEQMYARVVQSGFYTFKITTDSSTGNETYKFEYKFISPLYCPVDYYVKGGMPDSGWSSKEKYQHKDFQTFKNLMTLFRTL